MEIFDVLNTKTKADTQDVEVRPSDGLSIESPFAEDLFLCRLKFPPKGFC